MDMIPTVSMPCRRGEASLPIMMWGKIHHSGPRRLRRSITTITG